jgi:hypothetical protein
VQFCIPSLSSDAFCIPPMPPLLGEVLAMHSPSQSAFFHLHHAVEVSLTKVSDGHANWYYGQ